MTEEVKNPIERIFTAYIDKLEKAGYVKSTAEFEEALYAQHDIWLSFLGITADKLAARISSTITQDADINSRLISQMAGLADANWDGHENLSPAFLQQWKLNPSPEALAAKHNMEVLLDEAIDEVLGKKAALGKYTKRAGSLPDLESEQWLLG